MLLNVLPLFGNFHLLGQILPEAFALVIVPPVPAVAAFHCRGIPAMDCFALFLPRLGLWSRDKAAKGTAGVASDVVGVGRIDVVIVKVEVVGVDSIRAGPRRPAVTVPASGVYKQDVYCRRCISLMDTPAPHKKERVLFNSALIK